MVFWTPEIVHIFAPLLARVVWLTRRANVLLRRVSAKVCLARRGFFLYRC